MKKQLEDLAQEMILEVKNLKDLAKNELPEISKEYIRYNTTSNLLGFILTQVVVVILSILGFIFRNVADRNDDHVVLVICVACAIMIQIFSIPLLMNFLSFKLQPRRHAIKAITSLLGKE